LGTKQFREYAELIGIAALVISLVIVVYELRQNTNALQGAATDAISERQQFELYWSSEMAAVFVKAIRDPEKLTAIESWQLSEWHTSAIAARQSEFSQYRLGLIEESDWRTSEGVIQSMFSFKWSQDWWEAYREMPWNDDFKQRVDDLIETNEFDYADLLDQFSRFGTE